MIVINKINNLLFLNVESLINGVNYGLTLYVYDFIFCLFLDPLKHNQVNVVNYPSDYLVQISDLG